MANSLQELESYNTDFLIDLSEYANKQGIGWSDTYSAALARAQGMNWEGYGDEAMQMRMISDTGRAVDAAGTSMTVGEFAAIAAGDLTATHSAAMYAVQDARAAQFTVNDDFSVTDNLQGSLIPGWNEARAVQRQALSTAIQDAVRIFRGHRQTVAETLQGHQATLEAGRFADGTPIHGGAVAVDNHTIPDPPRPAPAVKYTPQPHPPAVINEHGGKTPVPADPRDHNGSAREIVDGFGKVAIGIGTEAGGVLAAPATGGASLVGTVPGGALPIFDGLDDLSHLTNMGRLPDAPPVIGQDGPG